MSVSLFQHLHEGLLITDPDLRALDANPAYTQILEAARTGKPHPNFVRGGLKDGFVKTSPYGSMVSEAARKNADAVKAKMMAGSFDIFGGELKDNTGKVVIPKGKVFKQTDVELEGMNYLVEGVIGKILVAAGSENVKVNTPIATLKNADAAPAPAIKAPKSAPVMAPPPRRAEAPGASRSAMRLKAPCMS